MRYEVRSVKKQKELHIVVQQKDVSMLKDFTERLKRIDSKCGYKREFTPDISDFIGDLYVRFHPEKPDIQISNASSNLCETDY